MNNWRRSFALTVALACLATVAQAAPPDLARVRLQIEANDTPLSAVLMQVARQTERKLVLGTGLEQKVTVKVNGVAFATAIRLLARPTGLVLYADGDRLIATVPTADLKALRSENRADKLSEKLAPLYRVIFRPGVAAYGTTYPPGAVAKAVSKAILLRAIELAKADQVDEVASLRELWRAPELFPGLLDETLFSAYLNADQLDKAVRLAKTGEIDRELWIQEFTERLPAWGKSGALPAAVELYVKLAAKQDDAEVDLGWELYAVALSAKQDELAETLRRQVNLRGERWVAPFQRRTEEWAKAGELNRIAASMLNLTEGRELTGAEASLIARVAQMLLPDHQSTAEALLRERLDDSPLTPAIYDLGTRLVAARLGEEQTEEALALWRVWYHPQQVTRHLANVARVQRDPMSAFASYRQLIATSRTLGQTDESERLRSDYSLLRKVTPRTIRVLPVVDTRILVRPGWRRLMDRRLNFVSQQYRRQFGMELELLGYHSWKPDDKAGPVGVIRQLQKTVKRVKADLVIGFITHIYPDTPEGRKKAGGRQILGMGAPEFRGYMIIRDIVLSGDKGITVFKTEIINETFVHEMGHIFGAMHVDDVNSVMRQGFGNSGAAYTFDALNARIITRCKWMDLGVGFRSLEDSELKDLATSYAELRLRYTGKEGNGADMREAQVRLLMGERYAARGEKSAARDEFRSVVALDADKRVSARARSALARLGGE